jgi:hypothetical protein
MNSGLLRKEVAHYFFGWYAIKCWESKYFWENLVKEDPYWNLFRDFVLQMKEVESSFHYRRADFRL